MSDPIPKRALKAPKLRKLQPTPKEVQAWNTFQELAHSLHDEVGSMPAIVRQELDRLCDRGNVLALRFRDQLALADEKLRAPGEEGKAPVKVKRVTRIRWQHSGD